MAKKLTPVQESAQGQDCTIRAAGICNYNPETTILAHVSFNWGTAKRLRPNERNAVFACSSCHDFIGNGTHSPEVLWYVARGLVLTYEKRDEIGV